MAKTKITLGSMGLTDADADRLLFWDDSAGAIAQLAASTNLTISGTNVTASGGKLVQVVTASNTTADTNSTTSYADSGNEVDITPGTNTNKILVHFSIPINLYRASGTSCRYGWKVLRDSTVIASGASTNNYGLLGSDQETSLGHVFSYSIYDEPDSTSEQTYKVQFANNESGNLVAQVSSNESNITAMEIEST